MPVSPKGGVNSRFHERLPWLDLTEPHGRPRLPSAPGALHPKRRRLASRNFSMTPTKRREAARLRSERWRRAHGIGPRRPAQRPWLAEGCSRSTWYRRRKAAREREALATRQAMFDRAEAFAAALRRDLERCAAAQAIMARELALPTVKLI